MLGSSAPSYNKNIVCRVETANNKRASKQTGWEEKEGQGRREGGREVEKKDRQRAAVATGEVSCKNTHTHGRLSCPIRQITVEKQRGGGVRWMECVRVCVCVCVCVCVWPGVRLISFTGLDKISLSDTLTHTHTRPLKSEIFTSLMWGNLSGLSPITCLT